MLYVVSVFRTVNVYDLSRFIPYIFYIFSPFFYEEPDAQEKRYQSSFFESNPYSSLPHRRKYVVVTGSKRISHVSSSRRTLIPRSRREREKEPRFTSSRTSALPLIRVSGKRSFWVY